MGLKEKIYEWRVLIPAVLKANGINRKNRQLLASEQMESPLSDFTHLHRYMQNTKITIQIDENNIQNKELLFKMLKFLNSKNFNISLLEFSKLLPLENIKGITAINPEIEINLRYLIDFYHFGSNMSLSHKVVNYEKIMEKVEFFVKTCTTNFKTQEEQALFTIMQLLDYINYDEKTTRKYEESFENISVELLMRLINNKPIKTPKEKKLKDIYDKYVKSSNLEGAFLNRKTVCIGYSLALKLVLDELGIPCNIVKSNTHAWNQIKLNDEWMNIDLTWFSSSRDNSNLLVSDEEFKHHYSTKKDKVHLCTKTFPRDRLQQLLSQMDGIKNVFEAYDRGSHSHSLQYTIQNRNMNNGEYFVPKERIPEKE